MTSKRREKTQQLWENKQKHFISSHQGQNIAILSSINLPYEKMYYDIARRFFDGIQQSQHQRDERATIVIMSQLSLEAFINRIGIEVLAEKEPSFDIKRSLESDKFLDKFILNDLSIPSYPSKHDTRVYNYTDQNSQPPHIGEVKKMLP
ncbi:MAG: hypothetical protein ACREOO_30805 [bacterium]